MALNLSAAQALRLWHAVNLHMVRDDEPDLSVRQISILLTVYLEAPPHTVRDLARKLGVSKPVITRALDAMGERCRVFESRAGWAWIQLESDGYVGYVGDNALAADIDEPTHRVSVPLTFIYPAPNVKSQPVISIPMNAEVTAVGEDGKFTRL